MSQIRCQIFCTHLHILLTFSAFQIFLNNFQTFTDFFDSWHNSSLFAHFFNCLQVSLAFWNSYSFSIALKKLCLIFHEKVWKIFLLISWCFKKVPFHQQKKPWLLPKDPEKNSQVIQLKEIRKKLWKSLCHRHFENFGRVIFLETQKERYFRYGLIFSFLLQSKQLISSLVWYFHL